MARTVTHPISVRLTEDIIETLDEIAERMDTSRSKLIVRAVESFVETTDVTDVADGRPLGTGSITTDLDALKRRMTLIEQALKHQSK